MGENVLQPVKVTAAAQRIKANLFRMANSEEPEKQCPAAFAGARDARFAR
ncbi:MAG TPA: hypothetical protein VGY98_14340 [Verrucomicrobiae bacterium]|nr:hypothetical protein [Verrucomicrobiae bacterium]